MRPAGEVRAALRSAAESLAAHMAGGITYRDMAEAGRVGYQVARETCRNMARSVSMACGVVNPANSAPRRSRKVRGTSSPRSPVSAIAALIAPCPHEPRKYVERPAGQGGDA